MKTTGEKLDSVFAPKSDKELNHIVLIVVEHLRSLPADKKAALIGELQSVLRGL